MMKKYNLFILFLLTYHTLSAQINTTNHPFVKRDSLLTLNLYTPQNLQTKAPCIIFLFGGGFISGNKNQQYNIDYCKAMANKGYIVAAIDYRQGMKNQTKTGVTNLKPLTNAINMAVQDLYAATNYLLQNAQKLQIDTTKIIINGSSAGAIAVLQADYELANQNPIAQTLPPNFHYAAVISFAGAILSYKGTPKYKNPPAPTMFFHGTEDKLVKYNKIQFFNIGFFGTNQIVKHFQKKAYPYCAYRYKNLAHEIASIPMYHNLNEIHQFIQTNVLNQTQIQQDITITDNTLKPNKYYTLKPKDLYKKRK